MKIADITEGYKVLPPIDKVKYQPRDGLEGPFRLRNGKVVYYDPQEGSYYDPDTDMYISYDDYKQMDEANLNELGGDQHYGDATGAWDKGGKATPITAKKATKNALKTLNKAFKNTKKPEKGVAEGELATYLVSVMDSATGEHWRIEVKVTSPEMAKERAEAMGYKVLGVKEKPSMGGSSPHPYQGKLVGATEAEVSNTDYEWTHGKKPSGQGSWFFVAHKGGINFGKDVEGEDYIQLNQMSYADAKKAAIKWAKSKGHTSLFVAT
jgi:hypothetical protein